MSNKASNASDWLADANIRSLFMEFPIPLVSCPAGGKAFPNRLFNQLFGAPGLDYLSAEKPQVTAALDWQDVRMPDSSGFSVNVRIRSLDTPNGTMVIIEKSEGPQTSQEVAGLHGRIAELERLSAIDVLTGAWNRAHLDRVVDAEIARSLRLHQPLSLILLDIDHFKSVNDAHGHAVGDAVLKQLVRVVRSCVRSSDLVFRWGGEEFVVLCPATGFRRAARLAEKLRETVASRKFPNVEKVTLSLGVAEHLALETSLGWFKRVDGQLYLAKQGGRNRICVDERGSAIYWAKSEGGGALQLDWREEYESGNDIIDAQHRQLFELANQLIDVFGRPLDSGSNALDIMDDLIAHAQRHFQDEEAIMRELGFAELEEHVQAHSGLRQRALELRAGVTEGTTTFGAVVEFLARDLVARHLFTADRKYYPLTRKKL